MGLVRIRHGIAQHVMKSRIRAHKNRANIGTGWQANWREHLCYSPTLKTSCSFFPLSIRLLLGPITSRIIARMQNKLCDVTKCLTTVAAGVLYGRDRKEKLETGLLFEVLLLDQQISFGVRLFSVTRSPHVPLVTCQKAQT